VTTLVNKAKQEASLCSVEVLIMVKKPVVFYIYGSRRFTNITQVYTSFTLFYFPWDKFAIFNLGKCRFKSLILKTQGKHQTVQGIL